MQKKNPLIYIILVNYHGYLDTIECLKSLFKLEYNNFCIVVVDNSNDAISINVIKNWMAKGVYMAHNDRISYSKSLDFILINEDLGEKVIGQQPLVFIKVKNNNGFAAANNVAIKYIDNQYDWVWILNNDTVVAKNCLTMFQNHIELNGNVQEGIIGTNLYDYDNPTKLQGIGGVYNKWFATSSNLVKVSSNQLVRVKQFNKKADYIIGASMFVSFKFIMEVGLMDENYFLFFEEIDWSTRGKKFGYKLGYAIDCNVFHKEGASIGTAFNPKKRSMIADYFNLKNKIIFTRKFFPLILPIIYLSLIISFFLRVYRKQFRNAKMVIRIIFESFKKRSLVENISNF